MTNDNNSTCVGLYLHPFKINNVILLCNVVVLIFLVVVYFLFYKQCPCFSPQYLSGYLFFISISINIQEH